jgi:hypothetical protein
MSWPIDGLSFRTTSIVHERVDTAVDQPQGADTVAEGPRGPDGR